MWRSRVTVVNVVNEDDTTLIVPRHPDRHIETACAIVDDARRKKVELVRFLHD